MNSEPRFNFPANSFVQKYIKYAHKLEFFLKNTTNKIKLYYLKWSKSQLLDNKNYTIINKSFFYSENLYFKSKKFGNALKNVIILKIHYT
jgi:hypothetical protein